MMNVPTIEEEDSFSSDSSFDDYVQETKSEDENSPG